MLGGRWTGGDICRQTQTDQLLPGVHHSDKGFPAPFITNPFIIQTRTSWEVGTVQRIKSCQQQANKPQSYASSKLQPTD